MRRRSFHLSLLAVLLVLMPGATGPSRPALQDPVVDNVRAFAKLYGYVRYFHPSDEASAVDWGRFAHYGVHRVRDAESPEDLRRVLDELFLPLAPTLQLYAGDTPPPAAPGLVPADTAGLVVVTWQHKGVAIGDTRGMYESVRLNRKHRVAAGAAFGTVVQSVAAAPYRGRAIRLRAAVRAEVEGTGNQAQLWLRVDRPNGQRGFFDNMGDRPVTSPAWGTYEIAGTVADDADQIVFGGFLLGRGKTWMDDFRLDVRADDGSWEAVPVENAGFEAGTPGVRPPGWGGGNQGFTVVTAGEGADGSARAVMIAAGVEEMPATMLFDRHATVGDVVVKPLGRGLSARIPLALYSDAEHTLPAADGAAFARLTEAVQSFEAPPTALEDEDVRLGEVVHAWNVFQHFYPYFDVVDTDWDAVLTTTLQDARAADDVETFQRVLRRMVVQLGDGHGGVFHPASRNDAGLPFLVDRIEDRVVVVATADSTRFLPGDVVLALDGVPAADVLAEEAARYSGTPQWRQVRARYQFGWGDAGTEVRVRTQRSDAEAEHVIRRDFTGQLQEARPAEVEQVEDGIYYVDLTRVEAEALQARVDELARAKGVVFDVRGYPRGNPFILSHLTDVPLRSARWNIPQVIYPDREQLAGYDTTGRWLLPPLAPRFEGKVAFLTDGSAISYAESVMGIVEHYRLGEIVGSPTAGANGNVNPILLPSGFRISWTGMKVLKHDGSQHHLVGIRPTVPVTRTYPAVREGRDEVLEKALELVR